MRYTDRDYTFKVSTGLDIIRFIFITCLLAPVRFMGEISKKIVFIGYKKVKLMFYVATGIALLLVLVEVYRSILAGGVLLSGFTNLFSTGGCFALLVAIDLALELTTIVNTSAAERKLKLKENYEEEDDYSGIDIPEDVQINVDDIEAAVNSMEEQQEAAVAPEYVQAVEAEPVVTDLFDTGTNILRDRRQILFPEMEGVQDAEPQGVGGETQGISNAKLEREGPASLVDTGDEFMNGIHEQLSSVLGGIPITTMADVARQDSYVSNMSKLNITEDSF
jgi:hypothetical protein